MKHIDHAAIYRSSEIAEIFGLAERHLWPLLKSGELPGRKIGKHWFCVGSDILDFVSRGNQAGIAHAGNVEQPADKVHDSDSQHNQLAQSPGTVPTVTPTASTADKAQSLDKTVKLAVTGKALSSDSQLTPRQQRRKAVMDAYAEAGNDKHAAAELLNQRIAKGGPKPERSEQWTSELVRQTVLRLDKRLDRQKSVK